MLSPTNLFIATMQDLMEKVNSPSTYKMIRASGLLRQLFLDGGSGLIHQVNREFKVQLEFKMATITNPPAILKEHLYWGNPIIQQQQNGSFSLQQFLSYPVLYLNGDTYTIKNFIKVGANILGGVHLETEDGLTNLDKRDKNLIGAGTSILLGQSTMVEQTIHSISRVAFKGLTPILDAIKASQGK